MSATTRLSSAITPLRHGLFLFVAGLLTLSFFTRPYAVLDNEADPSLGVVLSYAHQHGLQFGTGLVYTYGPLGFLIFPHFQPHASLMRLIVNVVLCYTTAAGLCRVAWRLPCWYGWLLPVMFAWTAANIQPRTDLVIDAALFAWGLLCFTESGRWLAASVAVFTMLAAFTSLAKVSFLFVAGGSLALIAADLLARERGRLAFVMAMAFGAAFVSGWLCAGQSLAHLGPFLTNSIAVVQGYNQAQGWEGMEIVRSSAIALALMSLTMVLLRTLTSGGRIQMHQCWLLAWLLLFSFTVWKHGFARGDAWHVVLFLGFVPVLALGLGVVPCVNAAVAWLASGIAAVCCLVTSLALQEHLFVAWPKSLLRPLEAVRDNTQCLLNPGQYQRRMMESIAANKRSAQLPWCRQMTGRANADLFGRSQACLIYNDLNYRPRPVFQSYAACNAQLMLLNERFYFSPGAPQFVLFEMAGIDPKFPPLEDGWLLRDLLINYELAGAEGRYLLLKSKAANAPKLTLLGEGFVRPGQPIDLSVYGQAGLWLEITVKQTWTGWLRQCFYRPAVVRLAAWREFGKERITRRRAPASMLAAGFLASPLVLNNDDVLKLYQDGTVNRPAAYSIEIPPGEERLWQEQIHFRVCRIEGHF